MSANEIQVAGTHYKSQAIQPWDYIISNEIPYMEGNVIKYVSRWRDKGGIDDLRKASEMVDHVVGFVARLRAQGDAGVRKFAGQLLEGRGGDEQDQGVQLMTGKGLRTLEESLVKLQDPKTPRAALEAVYRELPSVFARSFQLMHRADTDSAKREIHEGRNLAFVYYRGAFRYIMFVVR